MVKYNKGRFIFMFDSITRKLSSIYDTNYDTLYNLNNPGFSQVYGVAVESLNNECLKELKAKLKDDDKHKYVIDKILSSREESSK